MPEYLAEHYLSGADGALARRAAGRARVEAERMTTEGTPIELLQAIFIPGDETCMYLYKAESSELVRRAGVRCSLRFERISQAHTA